MRRIGSTLVAIGVGAVVMGASAFPAYADTGEVTIFFNEFVPLKTYEQPQGCHTLPPGAHVLNNQTDYPVRIYADPLCLSPSLTVQPGYGSHISPFMGSFSD
jgi:hypothetical protein